MFFDVTSRSGLPCQRPGEVSDGAGEPAQLPTLDDIGRRQVDNPAERADEGALLDEPAPRRLDIEILTELHSGDSAADAYIGDLGKAGQRIEFVEQLPKTVSGKIKRAELRAREWGDADGG